MKNEGSPFRVLALDPTSRGFGFVVFEGPETLIDWGLAHVRPADQYKALARIEALIKLHQPDLVVVENTAARDSRRSLRVKELLKAIVQLAQERKVRVQRVSRRDVRQAFANGGAVTKEQIASVIASRYRELASRLPPPRKIWMSEDVRMSLFDAAALACTYFSGAGPWNSARSDRAKAA